MNRLLFCVLLGSLSIGYAHSQYDTLKTASGVKYVMFKKGTGAQQPIKGQKVKVKYIGKLPNGKRFDPPKGPAADFQFKIGAGEVIPGWDEGVTLMHVGEVGFLFVPPNLAYGSRGVPDEEHAGEYIIPPNTELMFEIELVSIK